MKTTLGALFFLCTITCYAQDTTLKKVVVLDSTTKFEIEAEFPGGGGLREEAIRVIRESGKWVPAIQNGKNVASFKQETISFKMLLR